MKLYPAFALHYFQQHRHPSFATLAGKARQRAGERAVDDAYRIAGLERIGRRVEQTFVGPDLRGDGLDDLARHAREMITEADQTDRPARRANAAQIAAFAWLTKA